MEGPGCSCAAPRARDTWDRDTWDRDTWIRTRTTARFSAVALLLLAAAVLALLVLLVHRAGPGAGGPVQCTSVEPSGCSSEKSGKQRQVGSSISHNRDGKRPSAMLTAPVGNKTDGNYLRWESELGNAFVHGGFSYSGGSLLVPRTGTYRVFLQVTYEGVGRACPGSLRLTSTVLSISPKYNRSVTLLTSMDTVNCSQGPWIRSLSTLGLFLLDAGGRLHVTSSHPALMAKNEYQVFFGADLISE
ncbi:lymphotoxin-alpha isoform X1 [Cololabis saira]|uniref:lymphotoxin-alpha isoform X1 n=1 Tax=Cololabis saira TaxID=129043 RepID=UPI002AD41EE8|nr:lymphotoxin-alpha isoform X1 [Cololabis saira]